MESFWATLKVNIVEMAKLSPSLINGYPINQFKRFAVNGKRRSWLQTDQLSAPAEF